MSALLVNAICPVCGNEVKADFYYECSSCKFNFAFISYFAGQKSKLLWNKKVEVHKKEIQSSVKTLPKNKLVLGRDLVGIVLPKTGELKVIFGDGRTEMIVKDVVKFITKNTNSAILFSNGTVRVEGDNTYRQCDVEKYSSVTDIDITSTFSLLVMQDGTVNLMGSIAQEIKTEIKKWDNISKIFSSEQLVVGITQKGEIKVAAEFNSNVDKKKINEWKNVVKICVIRDKCIALFEDGTVKASWNDESISDIESWKDIIDIVYDGTYIVAITSKGSILFAGKAKNKFLEAGRTEAANWKNVLGIACSEFAISGYDSEHRLLLAGKVGGKNSTLIKEWDEKIKL